MEKISGVGLVSALRHKDTIRNVGTGMKTTFNSLHKKDNSLAENTNTHQKQEGAMNE
jgi:hypothetical protein